MKQGTAKLAEVYCFIHEALRPVGKARRQIAAVPPSNSRPAPHSNLEKANSLKTTPVLAQRWAVWSILTKNNSCRRLLGLPMRNSLSGMFVQCNLLSFGELLRKSIFAFRGRIQSSNNTVIKCMVNSMAPLVSNVWKWWRTTLYTGHVTV